MGVPTLQQIRAELARSSEFWRRRLVGPEGLAKLAQNLGLGWFTADDITGLWRIGLLRADLVSVHTPIEDPHLLLLGDSGDEGMVIYCDSRRLEHRRHGYGSLLNAPGMEAPDWTLAFHPYRLYVLYHVQRTLKVETSNTQYLRYEEGVITVTQRLLESLRRWTSSVEFGERFHYWKSLLRPQSFVSR